MVQMDICFGFAAATSNCLCEGYGKPYDLRYGHNVKASYYKEVRRENWQHSLINPNDIVRFAVFNNLTEDPPIIVSCDLKNLISCGDYRRGLLDECCVLTETDRERTCHRCRPARMRPVAYVTKNRQPTRYFCQYHARQEGYDHELMFYLPRFLSWDVNHHYMFLSKWSPKRRGLSRGESLSCRDELLSYHDLSSYRLPDSSHLSNADFMLRVAQEMGMTSTASCTPINVARALRSLCTAFKEPCRRSGPDVTTARSRRATSMVADQRYFRSSVRRRHGTPL